MSVSRIPVDQLGHYAENNTISFDFENNPREDFYEEGTTGTPWTFWESFKCEGCGQPSNGQNICENEECENYQDEAKANAEAGPISNIYWEICLPHTLDEDAVARAIHDLPLCLVKVDEEYGLNLNGFGMNFIWEIVEGFTRIGSLPPVHKIDLASMADRGESEKDRYLIEACKRAGREAIGFIQRDLDSLDKRFS